MRHGMASSTTAATTMQNAMKRASHVAQWEVKLEEARDTAPMTRAKARARANRRHKVMAAFAGVEPGLHAEVVRVGGEEVMIEFVEMRRGQF